MDRRRIVVLASALATSLVAAGCRYPPTDPSAQELMARGEGPVYGGEGPPAPGDWVTSAA